MTWADFIDLVEEHLSVDAQRRGLETFRLRMMRNAVVDLQRYIKAYQQGHTTTYQEADLDQHENGMVGNLPSGAIPSAFYIVSTKQDSEGNTHEDCQRNRLDYFNWENRRSLLCGTCDRRKYGYAIAPQGRMFAIHPLLNDETYLLLIWQGLKSDFEDADVVPWPEEAAEAVAAYVKWRILLDINQDPVRAREEYAIWTQKRLALYRDEQEKLDAEKSDEEYSAASAPTPPNPNW